MSGSLGARADSSGSGSVSGAGFEAFGSSPALIALAMRTAWYLAYLILERFSCSNGAQIWHNSRNVAAAKKVSAVCLSSKVG